MKMCEENGDNKIFSSISHDITYQRHLESNEVNVKIMNNETGSANRGEKRAQFKSAM